MSGKKKSLIECFSVVQDPRINRRKKHQLIDIIVVAACATISGAETWVDIEHFGCEREEWLKKFLELPHGIPSHDTFARVFSILDPKAFEKAFYEWTNSIHGDPRDQLIAIDGKCLKGSFQLSPEKRKPIHMVSAWASQTGVVLAQAKAATKDAHELNVMKNLVDLLSISGCTVSLDAMGTDRELCGKILAKEADYLIAVKKNQRFLFQEIEAAFKNSKEEKTYQTTDNAHGRQEKRNYLKLKASRYLSVETLSKWPGLNTLVLVRSERTETETRTQYDQGALRTEVDERFYITSSEKRIPKIARSIRSHWSIENQLHWKLDVSFNEDECRARIKNSAENFAVLRHIAINLLSQEKTKKRSMKSKRLLAGWNTDYLSQVVFNRSI